MKRKLVAALACRNQGSRLYGKPIQNLDIKNGVRIIDNLIGCLQSISSIDEIVLGISEGIENKTFISIANEKQIKYIIGDEEDVLSRLISCGDISNATDIFRVTSESPFLFFEPVDDLWDNHKLKKLDATFYDDVVDGSGFEILSMHSLKKSHKMGGRRHRSELCSLYIRENIDHFKVEKPKPIKELIRKDLRLTVDNPEDLVICRKLFEEFKDLAPRIPVLELIKFLDRNTSLKDLVYPLTESGYKSMYL
tara:strand:+ start:22953 stop:23705 length:753 start_codon:yes stop_codon:yes gene_type:complete